MRVRLTPPLNATLALRPQPARRKPSPSLPVVLGSRFNTSALLAALRCSQEQQRVLQSPLTGRITYGCLTAPLLMEERGRRSSERPRQASSLTTTSPQSKNRVEILSPLSVRRASLQVHLSMLPFV